MQTLRQNLVDGHLVVPVIFLLALVLRIALLIAFPQLPISDGQFYFDRARELSEGLGYQDSGVPTAYWPVGYPALMAATMLVFGKAMMGPMILNLVSAMATLTVILWFGRHVVGSEGTARLAALLYAIYPGQIGHVGTTFSETSSTALTLVAFAIVTAKCRSSWWLVLTGAMFGFATLMRAQTLFFPFVIIATLFLVYRSFGWRDALKALLLVHIAMFTVILPWSLRNERVMGTFVLISTNGGYGMYVGANSAATGGFIDAERGPLWAASGIPHDQRIIRQVELDQRFRGLAKRWIAENPAKFIALGFRKVALLWITDGDGFWGLQYSYPDRVSGLKIWSWVNQCFYMLILAASLPALFRATSATVKQDRDAPLLLLFCPAAYVTVIAFFFTGQTRYHHPAIPLLLVAASWSIVSLHRRWQIHDRENPATA